MKSSKYFFKVLAMLYCWAFYFVAPACAQQTFVNKLAPHHATLQWAGGIGFLSAGIGYATHNNKFEVDLLYGYLPAKIGGVEIHSATVKLVWVPLRVIEKKDFYLEPLMVGVLGNYSFGKQYFAFKPANYPYSYYKFPTAVSSAILVGSRVGIQMPKAKPFKAIAVYYELLAFDKELISLVNNRHSLDLDDILSFALGLKVYFK